MVRRFFVAVISIIYLAALAFLSFSGPAPEPGLTKSYMDLPVVNFSAGSYSVDASQLKLVLQDGETALLSYFPNLKSADFSGSKNYREIAAWGKENPQVDLDYTVHLPDGTEVDDDVESLDLSRMDSQALKETLEVIPYLSDLKSLDLGSGSEERSLNAQDLSAVMEAFPQLELSYSFPLGGNTVSLTEESLDLSQLSAEDIELATSFMSLMPQLKTLELGAEGSSNVTWEQIGKIQESYPELTLNYKFSLYGKELSLLDEKLDFNHINMTDEGAAVKAILPYMKNCSYLDMDFCGVSNAAMDEIRQQFPQIKVVWRIWFGDEYSVRTDVERILASKPSVGGNLDSDDVAVLKYCTDAKYIDLGHNEEISDISFVSYMPNLEVLIIAMNPVVDISPLADCPKLEYLELNSTDVADLSPLAGATALRHLNIGNCKNVTDISPLYGLTELERFWIGSITPVPKEQVEKMQSCAPDCEINTEVYDPVAGNWRVTGYTELSLALYEETGWLQEVLHPRYELLREQFGYTDTDYAFKWNDPLY